LWIMPVDVLIICFHEYGNDGGILQMLEYVMLHFSQEESMCASEDKRADS